jgi:hypothetical protein
VGRRQGSGATRTGTGLFSSPDKNCTGKALLAAALTMPAVQVAHAEAVPDRGYIAYKHLNYDDSQPSYDRISVDADSLMVMVPFQENWSISGTLTTDTISGASPAWHSEPISLSDVDDRRDAQDIRLTRYFARGSVTVGASHSKEDDYESRALSVQGSLATEDKNTTLSLGIGRSNDDVSSSADPSLHEKKRTTDLLVGVTRILTPKDIAQLNISYTDGHGYYSDPYKFLDNRPGDKYQTAMLARWNHYIEDWNGATQLGYRYYKDSFGIRAHTVTIDYTQELSEKWSVTPLLRLYTQSAADFYVENTNPPLPFPPPGYMPGVTNISFDQRLASFGARTIGIKIAYQPTKDWLMDFKYEDYAQRTDWSLTSDGSENLDRFYARMIQIGLARYF